MDHLEWSGRKLRRTQNSENGTSPSLQHPHVQKPLRKSAPFIKEITSALVDLPGPPNLSTIWNFGSLLGMCLGVQIVTGLFLAIHYTPHVDHAFASCIHISRDVWYGWLIRAWHANGASFFFLFLYIHIGRGIYYASYNMTATWLIGVIIMLVLIATAFIGYVLVWGQISLWAATVITNLLSAIPMIGTALVEWVWGGFAVNDATLHRFFVLHFLLPLLLAVLAGAHLVFLHTTGSSNPLGLNRDAARIPFHPYYVWKDVVGIAIALWFILLVSLLLPDLFLEPENFIPANPLVTPAHIKPEWYFLWVYAILRAIPNKLGGVMALFLAILILGVLPFIDTSKNIIGCAWCPVKQLIFWSLIGTFLLLTWLGSCPAEEPFNTAARTLRFLYFAYFAAFTLWVNRYLIRSKTSV